jgi:hypothetical protein
MVCAMTNKDALLAGPLDNRLNTPCTEDMKAGVVALAAKKGWKEADVVRAAVAQFLKEATRKR